MGRTTATLNVLVLAIFIFLLTTTVAAAETLIFQDDFSAGLTNWQVGYNTAQHEGSQLSVEDGKLSWNQGWDYIETLQSFSGNFRVEVDVERPGASVQCKDYSIELVSTPLYAGALRLQYGLYRKDSILLGQGPDYSSNSSGYQGECIHNSGSEFLQEMDTVTPHTGTASLVYQNGQLMMSFKNINGQTIQTPSASIGNIGSTKIRIAATASQLHYVTAVRVYSLDSTAGSDCATFDPVTWDVNIPCLMIGTQKYSLRLIYDPTIQGGYYWKLDLSSLQAE